MINYNGIHHLAFATADMDMPLRFWRDLLGMRLVAGIGNGRYRHYFLEISATDYTFDPNNIPIEFSAAVEEVDVRRFLKMTDVNPSILATEGPDPLPGRWPEVLRPTKPEEREIFPGEGLVLSGLADDPGE